MKIKVAILGGTGYTGVELLRYLLRHSGITISGITSERFAGKKINDVFPSTGGIDLVCRSIEDTSIIKNADFIFSCLPPEKSAEVIPEIVKTGKKVVDLSAAFRFPDAELYERWYHKHPAPELLKDAVYGIPEFNRTKIAKANLVANPGCYPISVLLPLIPLLNEVPVVSPVIVDSKSGVTGAGRNPSQELHFPEVNEGFRPYKPLTHRHQPEMETQIKHLTKKELQIAFVPHLLPINRGILSSIYLRTEKKESQKKIQEILEDYYAKEKFVRILSDGVLPNPQYIKGSNYCYISINFDERLKQIIIFSAIDNLGKGASGNAVQNMNIMMGFEEYEGLDIIPVYP